MLTLTREKILGAIFFAESDEQASIVYDTITAYKDGYLDSFKKRPT